MPRALSTFIKGGLARPTVWRATRRLRRPGVLVLMYHRIGGPDEPMKHIGLDVFHDQIKWITSNCEVVHPRDLAERSLKASGSRWPAVLVTFDDGYRDYATLAHPVLQAFGVPAVNFLPTAFIDNGHAFWWDILDTAVRMSAWDRAILPDGRSVELTQDGRQEYSQNWKQTLRRHAFPDQTPEFEAALGGLGVHRSSVSLERQVMTWDEVRGTADLTSFGGHTHNHPVMPYLDDRALDFEVTTCRNRIAAETGQLPRLFAYPGGAFSRAAMSAVVRAGYAAAFTTLAGFTDDEDDWIALKRIHAPPTVQDLPWLLTGWRS